MTESSKQRAKEFLNKMGKHPVWMHEDFLLGYEAGMGDPDAKKIFAGGIYWDAEKIEELIRNHTNQNVEAAKSLRESLVLIQKYKEENKKLRKVVLEADEIMKRNSMFPLDIATWRAHIKALSSGGE